ncbi:MAG: HAD family phosphatase [Clostridia bacterium]|nr:HAD family phosphatase [Clostridia bacterium]
MKNVIFDFGQVLVHFSPEYMTKRYVSDEEDARLISSVVFDRLYWDRLDDGTITDEEVMAASRMRLPERLWDTADKVYYNWIYNLPEMEGMRELILHIKEKYGTRVFLLSNIATYFADHASEIPIISLLDGCVFSAACGRVKPNADIYEHLCEKFGILPGESLFVDDRAENIAGARAVGMDGYLFDGDAQKLRAYLDGLLLRN